MIPVLSMSAGCTPNTLTNAMPASEELPLAEASLLSVAVTEVTTPQVVSPTRVFTGIIKADKTSRLSFGRNGRISQISVSVGDTVEAETRLGTLDQTELEEKQQGLKSSLDSTRRELSRLTSEVEDPAPTTTRQKLAQLQLEVDRLRSELENAPDSTELAEQVKLLEKQVQQFDRSKQQQKIQQLQQQMAQNEQELKRVERELAQGALIAPYDGVITSLPTFEGSMVSPAVSVIRMSSTGKNVQVDLPEQFAARLEKGQDVELSAGDDQFSGTVRTVLPEIRRSTRTRTVILDLPAESLDRTPTLGEIVSVEIPSGQMEKGFWLPLSALVEEDRGEWSVYVVEKKDDQATLIARTVEILHSAGDRVLVGGELKVGELVVIEGTHRLVPGQQVNIAGDGEEAENAAEIGGDISL